MTPLVHLGPVHVALAASLIPVNGLLSVWLGLGLEKKIAVTVVRTLVQLLVLGYVLVSVFAWGRPEIVLLLAMTLMAGREAIRRVQRTTRGIYLTAVVSMFGGCWFAALLGSGVIIGVDP